MSIWGKIIGGGLGFMVGHIPGALIGAWIGHSYDQLREKASDLYQAASGAGFRVGGNMNQIAFTIGVVVLGAKMAKADGHVSEDEIRAFKRIFRIAPEHESHVGRLFNQARQDAKGFEPYARQLAHLFRDRPAVLEELLGNLVLIAAADNTTLNDAEIAFLRQITVLFGFTERDLRIIAARCGVNLGATDTGANTGAGPRTAPDSDNPYDILGVNVTATDAAIKAAYRKLIMEHHPDKLIAAGLPPDFIATANEKMKRINAAYDSLRKQRGFH